MRLAAVLAWLTFVMAFAAATAARAQSTLTPEAAVAWGFDKSDLPPHPGVRFGVLPNGMRYALMPNSHPAGSLSVRLRIDVGAIAEGAREQGYLHLIEHMIFIRSTNHPRGSLLFTLPSVGLERFTDFNAWTTFDETVFRLDLAQSDRRARETALKVMHEIAEGLVFTRSSVDEAKQHVIEEIHGRDRAKDLLMTAQHAFLLPGTPLARGPVAGSVDSVNRASPDALRRLYDVYYAPARATLIVVGDVDAAAVETEIAALFSGWTPRAETPGLTSPAVSATGNAWTHFFVHRDVPTTVTFALVKPLGGPDTSAARMNAYLEHLGSELLNRRLAAAAREEGAPFQSPLAAVYDYFSTARLTSLDLEARGGDWRGALAAGERALVRALDEGFTQIELDALLSGTTEDGTQTPRPSQVLADAIVDSVNRRLVFNAPSPPTGDEGYLATVDVARVNAAFRAAWSGAPRLVFVSHGRPVADAGAAVAAALTSVAPGGGSGAQ